MKNTHKILFILGFAAFLAWVFSIPIWREDGSIFQFVRPGLFVSSMLFFIAAYSMRKKEVNGE